MLTVKDKEEIEGLIVKVIKDVVMPSFDTVIQTMSTKDDLKQVEIKLTGRINSIDRKLDIINEKSSDHEVRIKRLEYRQVSP